jgi:hypothetical protein
VSKIYITFARRHGPQTVMGAKIRGEGAGPGLANRIGGQREEACPKQIKRDWPKAGLGEDDVLCVRNDPALRMRPSRLLNSARVAARWEGGMGDWVGDWGSCPCNRHDCRADSLSPRLHLFFLSLARSPWPPAHLSKRLQSSRRNAGCIAACICSRATLLVPPSTRRHHRGLHMQQSHSSRHRCRLVAIVAPLVP